MAAVFELVAEGNRRPLPGARAALEEVLPVLGLDALLGASVQADSVALELLSEREEARAARDFARADRIRDLLAERGWEVRDTPEGARLVRRG
jgi:cysteinyl-tRNA synthetase